MPMKINFILDMEKSMEGSGIYTSAVRLAKMLRDEGFSVDINGKGNYDIYHSHTALPQSFLRLRLIKRRSNNLSKVVMHGHTTIEDFVNSFLLTEHMGFLRSYLIKYYSTADHLIAVSDYNKRLLMGYGFKDEDISVISNGINLQSKKTSEKIRSITRKYLGLSESDTLTLGIGISLYRKGIDDFFRIAERCPGSQFVWIGTRIQPGTASRSNLLKKIYKKAYKTPSIKFPGYVSYKTWLGLMNAADIYLYPTREENQGIALLEAILHEKAPLVRDIPVFEWLTHGKDSFKANTVEEFVKYHKMLSSDPILRNKIVKASQKHLEYNDLKKVSGKIIKVYENLFHKD